MRIVGALRSVAISRLLTGPRVVLVAMVAAWSAYFSIRSIDVHQGLGTSAYDVGLYDQGLWLLSQWKAPFSTLMGRNLFGDHASFVLFLVVPLYWVWPSISVLFIVQSVVIGLGAVPVFLAARRLLDSERQALVVACVYLLHPAVGWTNLENYHPDSFLAFFVGMAIFAALDRRWRLYAVFVFLSLLVKEDVLLVLVPLGIWVSLNRSRRIGVATVVASLAATAFGMLVVMRGLAGTATRNAWRIPFGGIKGLVVEAIERPGNVFDHFRSEGRPFYLWQMVFPTALTVLRYPAIAAISGLVLFTNVLSTFWYQFKIEYHYSLIAVPALVIGAASVVARTTGHRRRALLTLVATTTLWSSLMWGAVPVGRLVAPTADDPIGRNPAPTWPADHPVAIDARELMGLIPAGAPVAVFHSLAPHLTHRVLVYQFPNPFRVVLYGPDISLEQQRACLPTADLIEFVMLPRGIDESMVADWALVSSDFSLHSENDSFWLFRRTSTDIRCEGGILTSRP